MKLIPPEVSLRTPSGAEKKLFRLLRLVDLDGVFALHSVNLAEHEYKVCGEIDFLLVGPPGLFVLEVKGGRVGQHDGVWTFTDRYGKERRKAEGPFEQARSATFSLLDRLRDLVPRRSLPKLVFGWGVVFPDQTFRESSVEWAPEMVIDEEGCRTADDLQRSLRRLVKYWKEKAPDAKWLLDDEVEMIRRALRPDFDVVPSLRSLAEDVDSTLEALTESQYHLLDAAQENDRILCAGGAGTGKTFLAAEVARREAAAGSEVLLTCRSHILAKYLSLQPGLEAVTVAQLHTLEREQPFDSVIVDEGQDVMNLDDLVTLDRLVSGGLEGGRWRMFYDLNNQTGVLGSFDSEAFTLLGGAHPARLTLPDNCRNTRDIVGQVQLVTGADVGVSSAGAGLPVEYEFWSDQQEAAEQLATRLAAFLDDGVDPSHITVLSPLAPEDSCVALLPPKLRSRLRFLDAGTVTQHVNGIGFASIRDFKGLENRFICVVDFDTIDEPPEARSSLYVAMTRPRAALWLGLADHLRERLPDVRHR